MVSIYRSESAACNNDPHGHLSDEERPPVEVYLGLSPRTDLEGPHGQYPARPKMSQELEDLLKEKDT